ncbi:outer membrane beta-barrel protein [Myroides odoratus]|uniref:outer membrane beta-barrel protein n=1 Tax=Myroides odoratus TaxID=256 RepID=UPI0039AEF7BC
MKFEIKTLLLLCLLTSYYTVSAQYKPYYYKNQEIGVSVKAGLAHSYGSLPASMSGDFKFATAIGFQYEYYVNPSWSLGIGGQYARQTLDFKGTNLKGEQDQTDWEKESFIFRYQGKTYKEQWKVNQFNIPFTIQYVGKEETSLYVRTGFQYSLILNTKATLTWNQLKTSGYFPQYKAELNGPLFAGFGTQEKLEYEPNLEVKNRWAWIAEIGVKHTVASNQNVYIGFYFDLGLNNQKPEVAENKEEIIQYKPVKGQAIEQNSIQQSSKAVFKNYNLGIQIRYGFGV